jgi:hypothetical protein
MANSQRRPYPRSNVAPLAGLSSGAAPRHTQEVRAVAIAKIVDQIPGVSRVVIFSSGTAGRGDTFMRSLGRELPETEVDIFPIDRMGRVPLRLSDIAVAIVEEPKGTQEEIEEFFEDTEAKLTDVNSRGAKYKGLLVGNEVEPREIGKRIARARIDFSRPRPSDPSTSESFSPISQFDQGR